MEIKIYLLQRPRIEIDGDEKFSKLNNKAFAMIFYLAAKKGHKVSKELLSEIFWPEQSAEDARSNLRQSLSAIKTLCGEAWTRDEIKDASIISSERNVCSLNERLDIFVDIVEFRKAVHCAAICNDSDQEIKYLQVALDIHGTGFLNGVSVRGSIAFEEWVMMERESINQEFIDASKQLAFLYAKKGLFPQAIYCLKKLLMMDPLLEEVHLQLMELYCQNRERAKAIRQYKECVRILGEELNIGPMQETRMLYKEILSDGLEESERPSVAEIRQDKYNLCMDTPSKHPIEFDSIYYMLEPMVEENAEIPDYLKRGLAILFPQYSDKLDGQNLPESYLFYCIKKLFENLSLKGPVEIQVPRFSQLDQKSQKLLQYLIDNLQSANVNIKIFKEE